MNAAIIDTLLNESQRLGFTFSRIYIEKSEWCSIDMTPLGENVQCVSGGGISIQSFNGVSYQTFVGNSLSGDVILSSLKGKRMPVGALHTSKPGLNTIHENLRKLKAFSKEIGERGFSYSFQESRKYFEVADFSGLRGDGNESHVTFKCWRESGGSHHRVPIFKRDFQSKEALFEKMGEWDESTFVWDHQGWPAPSGTFSVVWSHNALSKLILCFLRIFEGDLVLRGGSILSKISGKLPFHFALSEETLVPSFDHEATERKKMKIFEEGTPKTYICDRRTGERLKCESTGHCRRESFRSNPTVSFWAPQLEPYQTLKDVNSAIQSGIRVDDIEVIHFEPSTGKIIFDFSSAHFIHHGEKGERMAPLLIQSNLLDILATITHFSCTQETVVLEQLKDGQKLKVFLRTPEGLSHSFDLPGSQSRYF